MSGQQKALDLAASTYAAPGQSDLWYPAASRLLERAGANLAAARAIRAVPGPNLASSRTSDRPGAR
jgi:hypothetical protein